MSKVKTEQNTRTDGVTINVPHGNATPSGYQSPRIDMRTKGEHHIALGNLRANLRQAQARLNCGLYVETNVDVVKWLLEEYQRQST